MVYKVSFDVIKEDSCVTRFTNAKSPNEDVFLTSLKCILNWKNPHQVVLEFIPIPSLPDHMMVVDENGNVGGQRYQVNDKATKLIYGKQAFKPRDDKKIEEMKQFYEQQGIGFFFLGSPQPNTIVGKAIVVQRRFLRKSFWK